MPAPLLRPQALALVAALALAGGCNQVGAAIEDAVFKIGVMITGSFGLLGLWALVSTLRGPRVGVASLVLSTLLGGCVLVLTVRGTDGLDPWPGTLTRHAAILMWLPQPLACLPFVAAARFAADRLPPARARWAWALAGLLLAVYLGLLGRATTRVIVPPLDGRVVAVAVGERDTYGLTDTGTLVVMRWHSLPGRFTSVRAAEGPAFAIDTGRRLHQLDGWRRPAPIAGPPEVVDLALAGPVACALDPGGRVHCRTHRPDRPPAEFRELPGVRDVVDLELAPGRLCAIDRAGAVACARLDPSAGPGPDLALAPLPLSDAAALALTRETTCALTRARAVVCLDDSPPLRRGPPHDAPVPVPAPVSGLTDVAELVAGEYHLCARDVAGAVRCWGGNGWNQLGPDSLGERRDDPVPIALPAPAARLFAHRTSTCAGLTDGRLFCWGAQPRGSGLLFGERCGRLLGPRNTCSDRPDEVLLPTTAIPLPGDR